MAPAERRSPPPLVPAAQAAAEDLEEAENELMLADEETVPYLMGECFVRLEKDEAEERVQQGAMESSGTADRRGWLEGGGGVMDCPLARGHSGRTHQASGCIRVGMLALRMPGA